MLGLMTSMHVNARKLNRLFEVLALRVGTEPSRSRSPSGFFLPVDSLTRA